MDEQQLYKKAIATWGIEPQTRMLLEEMAELQVAVCHLRRGREVPKSSIASEIADVEIMLGQLCMMENISREEVEKFKQEKLLRLKERLDKYKYP